MADIHNELEAMIPSETVRKYVIETGYTFTDWQKAALFYHGTLTIQEQFLWLRKLSDSTSDTKLKSQITEYLSREEQAIAVFKNNKDRKFLYILKYAEDLEHYGKEYENNMFFFNYEATYCCGKKQGVPFAIGKYRPYTEVDSDADDYENYSVSDMWYDKNGNAVYFQSSEIPYCEDSDEDLSMNFRDMYYNVPYPFEKGDIVRCIGVESENQVGVVETSQKAYYEWENRIPYLANPPDDSDVQVRVVFPNNDGKFCHQHINPIFLEYYNAELNSDTTGKSVLDNLLLAGSRLYKGEAILDDLYYWEAEYRKMKK